MEVSGIGGGLGANLGALRQYKTAQKALAPENNADKKISSAQSSGGASGVGKAAEAFSAVFENVENTMQAHATGQADAHSVVEAMANAELALETAVTIRNRVVEAYQELLRMPV